MVTMITRSQVIDRLKTLQGDRTQKELAADLKITPSYLSDIYSGKRNPGRTVLDKLGLKSAEVYESNGKAQTDDRS